jgi:glutamate-ammonia-ligase adenylyltransferase
MVHGRSDDLVRNPNTLLALEQLATWGYVAREDAATLSAAYRFLRTLEHRIQLFRMRRTHIMPTDEADQRRIGRSMGYGLDPIDELTKDWKKHAREVRRLHEKLFYRPLLNAVVKLDSSDARLSPEAASARLAALGYKDPANALRHMEALTAGVSRRAVIQRTLLPVMLEWFAKAPDPDSGLFGFRQVSEALGTTPWYLRLLRDESATAERLAKILATSRYATDLLLRAPEAVNLLASLELLKPRTRDELNTEVLAIASRYEDQTEAVGAIRAVRRRELFRVSCADILGELDVEEVGKALTDITDVTINGTLEVITRDIKNPPAFLVLAMGRFGGAELGYGSDADVMFCFEDGPDREVSQEYAHLMANSLRSLLMAPSPDPELLIDADLRPEGKNGPLVRSFDSFESYYQRWSSGWETQALLRANTCAGDEKLAAKFIALINPVRYRESGLAETELREIRRLKARMESERLPRGVDPALHTKLGPGGLSDVEWLAQIIQLQYGHAHMKLQNTRTLDTLRAAEELEFLSKADVAALTDAWILATKVRNALMLVKGKASDSVPTDLVDLARVAYQLGYGLRGGQELLDDYRRTTRRARQVVMREFYGEKAEIN